MAINRLRVTGIPVGKLLVLAGDRRWGGRLPWHKDCRHCLELGWDLSGMGQLGRRGWHEVGSLGRPVTRAGRHHMEAVVVRAVEGGPGACLVGEGRVAVVPVPRWGQRLAERAAHVACSGRLMPEEMQPDRRAPVVAGQASQESGWGRAWLSAFVHLHIHQEEPVAAVQEAMAAAAVVVEDVLEVCKAAELLVDLCIQLRAAQCAEGSDVAAVADASAAVASREVAAAAAAVGASAERPRPNLGSRCCQECLPGRFHLWVLSVH